MVLQAYILYIGACYGPRGVFHMSLVVYENLKLNTYVIEVGKFGNCSDFQFNPLRPKRHYSGFVINKQYYNYNSRMLWAMKLG